MNEDIITKLEDINKNKTGNMQLLADYLLKYEGEVSKIRAQNICNELYISIASATRLAKKLGFSGFNEMKVLLELEKKKVKRDKEKYNNTSLLGYKEIVVDRIESALPNVDEEHLSRISELIELSETIKFYGVGGSYFILEDFAHKISRLQKKIFINSDYHINFVNATNSDEKELVIAYSNSGKTKEVHNLLKLAKKSGATTILFTSNNNLNLNYVDEMIIVSEIENFKKTYSLSSRICALIILDYIFLKFKNINKEQKLRILDNTIYKDEIEDL